MTKGTNLHTVPREPKEIIIVGRDGSATAFRLLPEALERSHTVVLKMSINSIVEVEYHTWAEVADEPNRTNEFKGTDEFKRNASPTEREG